jgi:GntR family transcriptional regulator/MocR family aminotransferase
MPDLPITLDPAAAGPVYRQIVTRLRAAILTGTLPAGVRLPSSRGLASQLGVARGTVEAAYAVLAGEGVLLSRGPVGTVVSPHMTVRRGPHTYHAAPVAPPGDSFTAQRILPFRMGLPALDAFPRKLWSTLVAREIRASPVTIWPIRTRPATVPCGRRLPAISASAEASPSAPNRCW